MKTFQSIHTQKKVEAPGKKENKKEFALAQKTLDLDRERKYDAHELQKYDLARSMYLFDGDGFMVKPQKNVLGQELEKSLSPADYITPDKWDDKDTTYLVDVDVTFAEIENKTDEHIW